MQLRFGFGGNLQRVDKHREHLRRDAFFAAREVFEFFIRIGHAIAAHHRLNRLGQQFPSGIQIGGQRGGVGFELVQAAQVRYQPQNGVARAHTHIAQHGAVGEVALPARERQLFGQKAQHRIGHAQIAF